MATLRTTPPRLLGRRGLLLVLLILVLGCAGCTSTEEAAVREQVKTTFYSDPKGATLYMEGSPIGPTPCKITMPADKEEVEIQLRLPGYSTLTLPVFKEIDGWGSSYTFQLRRKRR